MHVKAAIAEVLPSLIPGTLATDLVAADLTAHATSPEHILAAARTLQIAESPDADVTATLARLALDGVPPHLDTMIKALAIAPENGRETLRAAFNNRLPLAFVFASKEEKEERAKAAEAVPAPEGKTDV